jgi:hypothetical protein
MRVGFTAAAGSSFSIFLLSLLTLAGGCIENDPNGPKTEGTVRNGSFEMPETDAPYVRMAPGLSLDGWTIADAPIDLVSDYWRAADGRQSVHIARGATLSQELLTTPGRTYELQFAAAANADPDGQNPTKHLVVMWGPKTVDSIAMDARMHRRDEMGWRYYAYPVKATSSRTVLRFSCEEKEEWGAALDRVRLAPAPAGTTVAQSK